MPAESVAIGALIALPIAGACAAAFGILLGFPVLRLRGDYLAVVTLAFGEIIRLVLVNWVPVTGGYAGTPVFMPRELDRLPDLELGVPHPRLRGKMEDVRAIGEWLKEPDDVARLALYLATLPVDGTTGQVFSLAGRLL